MQPSIVPIVIDGPNFINRILDLGIDKDIIARQITLDGLRKQLNNIFEERDINIQVDLMEFVCSKKLFGQGNNKFSQQERISMLQKLMTEKGVHIEEVSLPGSAEKGVDTAVSSMLESFSDKHESILLISHDRDFVPVLKKLREKGKKTYLIALSDKFPIELSNEAYQTIKIDQESQHLFTYSYPRYFINKDFSQEKLREMISNADDRQNNQLRVDKDGEIYYSFRYVGNRNIDTVKFRLETLIAFNGYVGPKAASDTEYVTNEYKNIIYGWDHDAKGYYDYPISQSGI